MTAHFLCFRTDTYRIILPAEEKRTERKEIKTGKKIKYAVVRLHLWCWLPSSRLSEAPETKIAFLNTSKKYGPRQGTLKGRGLDLD